MSSHATLSAASDDRKARLAKLKSLKRKQPTEPDADTDTNADAAQDQAAETETTNNPPTTDIARLHLSGRNYDFTTKGPKLGFEAPPTLELSQPTLEQQAQDLEDESRRQAAVDAQQAADRGIDLFKLQPKKPNWDLKRELNLRMEGLHVRTENAIARMVRERLAEKKGAAADAGVAGAARGGRQGGEDAEGGEGMLDGAELVEGMRLREREEEEENRREREAEAEEFGMA
jgi:coiled-coil domain-containing protein 12